MWYRSSHLNANSPRVGVRPGPGNQVRNPWIVFPNAASTLLKSWYSAIVVGKSR
jgi:hypothetical protein